MAGVAVFNWSDSAGIPFWGTNCFSATFGTTGGAQIYSNNSLCNIYGLSVGAMRYLNMEVVQPNTTSHFILSLHSRDLDGDNFSVHQFPCNNFVVNGPVAANTKQLYKFPLPQLGLGVTDFHGSISGTTMTVSSIDSAGTMGVDFPGVDCGAQIIGLGGTTVTAHTFARNKLSNGSGPDGVGAGSTWQVNNSQTSSGTYRAVRDIAYKWDWHNTTGGDAYPLKLLFNNMGCSRL